MRKTLIDYIELLLELHYARRDYMSDADALAVLVNELVNWKHGLELEEEKDNLEKEGLKL